MHQVFYTDKAREDLKRLERQIAKRIIGKIYFFSLQKDPLVFAKPLNNIELGQYRFRIGDYRALFDIDKKQQVHILSILRIKHRKDIYAL